MEISTIQLAMRERFRIFIIFHHLSIYIDGIPILFYSRSGLNFAHTEELENVSSGDIISRGKKKRRLEREIA